MRYRIIAIDLDGTLLDRNGEPPRENLEAIARAHAAGVTVVVCTGRALPECRGVLARIDEASGHPGPVITGGGALVSDPATGATIERTAMDAQTVAHAVDFVHEHDHPALLLKDAAETGYDYLIVTPFGPEAINPASQWWFKKMNVRTRFAAFVEDDPHPDDTLRVGVYAANNPIDALAASVAKRFATRASMAHFQGVLLPDERRVSGVESVHIVELFHPRADKWQALQRLAHRQGVSAQQVAAIGDQANDLPMITGAGLGVAMGNAIPAVTAAAQRRTLKAEEAGVAHAIDQMLSGAW